MRYVLLSMSVNGIKNIDREIELQFSNKILNRELDIHNQNVKAIYGPNGSGKTGIVYAVSVYQSLVLGRDFITISNNNGFLDGLINQISKTFFIKMVFARFGEENNIAGIYSHSFTIKNDDGKCYIKNEEFKELHGLRLKTESKWETIYSVQDGELLDCNSNVLYLATKNLLKKQSLSSIGYEEFINYYPANKKDVTMFAKISNTWNFALRLRALFNSYYDNYNNNYGDNLFTQFLDNQRNEYIVPKDMFSLFEQRIDRLTSFIRVFNDDLVHIEISKDENNDKYVCRLTLVYEDGRKIERKYESSGTKKLMDVYSGLVDADEGKIVFIDEFDANIHDVVLVKIVDYMREYADGQFVFTTHNLGPMDVLQNDKYAIEFLSSNSHIVTWTKMGNCSAASIYRKGYVKYSPFNIESFGFLGAFGDGTIR